MSDALILAIPSKGRLQEQASAIFDEAGLTIQKSGAGRIYRGSINGSSAIEVVFLSASEIAREIGAGHVHLGVTGADLVQETVQDWDSRIAMVSPLGFGQANVVVAVPQSWIDVQNMEDLDDVAASFRQRHGRRLRIATKYWNLTQRFFARHGIALYRIVESLGATEGAPASGAADAIVDITTTGSTLRDNHLKVLDDGLILKSEAHLAVSLKAGWSRESRLALGQLIEQMPVQSSTDILSRLDLKQA